MLLCLALFFNPGHLYPQQDIEKKTADLEAELKTARGERRFRLLKSLCQHYYNRNAKRSVLLAKEALSFREDGFETPVVEKAHLNVILANTTRQLGQIKEPIQYAREGLALYESLKSIWGRIITLNTLGNLYISISAYPQAQQYLRQASKLCETDRERFRLKRGAILRELGRLYVKLGQDPKALQHYNEALAIGDREASSPGGAELAAYSTLNIGQTNRSMGESDKALEVFSDALKRFERLNDPSGISAVYHNTGLVHLGLGQSNKALEYFIKARAPLESGGNHLALCIVIIDIARIFLEKGELNTAESYFNQALDIARTNSQQVQIRDIYKYLSQLNAARDNYKQALDYHIEFSTMKDKVMNESISRQISGLEAHYESEKKSKELALLRNEKKIQALTRDALLAVLFLVLVILALLFKKYLYLFTFWKRQKFIGQYRLMEPVGAGGMSYVVKAHNIRDKTQVVAIKVLREELSKRETNRKRFKQEGTIIDKLHHPHIIRVFERGEYHGKLYLVMEYLEGQSLAEVLEEKGQLPLDTCIHIMKQIASALTFIHARDIIHRDLKPGNIMVVRHEDEPNHVKLLDFGLSRMKFQSQLTMTGVLLGTANYLAPEQITDLHYSPAGDIYALGVVFYEILTGTHAFPGESFSHVENRILSGGLAEPGSIRREVPPGLNGLVMKMVSKDPANRPEAEEVLEQLESNHQHPLADN